MLELTTRTLIQGHAALTAKQALADVKGGPDQAPPGKNLALANEGWGWLSDEDGGSHSGESAGELGDDGQVGMKPDPLDAKRP
jgi:hypothetical protein